MRKKIKWLLWSRTDSLVTITWTSKNLLYLSGMLHFFKSSPFIVTRLTIAIYPTFVCSHFRLTSASIFNKRRIHLNIAIQVFELIEMSSQTFAFLQHLFVMVLFRKFFEWFFFLFRPKNTVAVVIFLDWCEQPRGILCTGCLKSPDEFCKGMIWKFLGLREWHGISAKRCVSCLSFV